MARITQIPRLAGCRGAQGIAIGSVSVSFLQTRPGTGPSEWCEKKLIFCSVHSIIDLWIFNANIENECDVKQRAAPRQELGRSSCRSRSRRDADVVGATTETEVNSIKGAPQQQQQLIRISKNTHQEATTASAAVGYGIRAMGHGNGYWFWYLYSYWHRIHTHTHG